MSIITDENHVGLKFGRLTIKQIIHCKPNKKCIAVCDCGKEIKVCVGSLKTGNTKSCGCFGSESLAKRNFKHGHAGGSGTKQTREYKCYTNMIQRCTNPKNSRWSSYGGNGIKVCERWLESFTNFLEDMGPCAPKLTLHRFPNDTGNYEPGSCVWADAKTQARDKTTTHHLLFDGVKMSLAEATDKLGCCHSWIGVTFKRRGGKIETKGHKLISLLYYPNSTGEQFLDTQLASVSESRH